MVFNSRYVSDVSKKDNKTYAFSRNNNKTS